MWRRTAPYRQRPTAGDTAPARVDMNSLLFLIPLSIVLVVGAGVALFWAINHGQLDDLETPGILPLLDADEASNVVAEGRAAPADASANAPRSP